MGPQADTAVRPQRSLLRRIFWAIVIGGGALILLNALLPDLDFSSQDRVALIRIEGVILDAQATISELKQYSENPLVKAIVLRIDSPGGGVVPSQEIHDAVKRVKNKSNKAVIASMGTVAASGGYYIAAATDRIIANPGTLTGSIGVIMEMANFEGLMKKVGVEGVVIKSGRFKDVGSPLRKMSDEERKLLQSVMDDVHHQFIQAVADGRSLEVSDVEPLADGRIYTGRQAKDARLVDELGDLDDAIHIAADIAGMEGEPKVVEPRKRFSFRDIIESRWASVFPRLELNTGVKLKYLMAF
ncbi:MAG: signal peptide peptidase SppA [Nitrospira sp.]|mgnify:FL=1|jgi:protease-4|uniref:signal peptide peptidase SppA n=1 Tax=Nitrospira sp. ND1 TaxID=1658518 RepID=UPI0009BC6FB1|nr:signal peptide peptidase SppA [Nitrospira sp. ND1]MBK7418663.1 signal peptide peptidase SppA [Nitrospira sp.]MBK8376379.1 signal peptide peptidase SppA [Nitrospira sp.]MBK9998693.1 signal peptide peptidase SppA [Nitrospira sp.]MBP6199295.1 signal peptide peptidase SppA [Nitrospira sp.]MBP6206419.1 signal peptide peptidase SppA [Nitrospira sp.]